KEVEAHRAEIVTTPQYKTKRQRQSPTIPFGREEALRRMILKEAGLTPERMGELLRKAISKAEEKLDAKTKKVFHYKGERGDEVELEDNTSQLQAAKQIMELTGAAPSKSSADGKNDQNVQIQVILPWGKGTSKTQDPPEGATP
ncbi:MAG: hypothetical protein ACYSTI_12420, partial [Planctomycetota bacterium]